MQNAFDIANLYQIYTSYAPVTLPRVHVRVGLRGVYVVVFGKCCNPQAHVDTTWQASVHTPQRVQVSR